MPRRRYEPTDTARAEVLALAGFGVRHEDIALYLSIDVKTLRKYYSEELKTGSIRANAVIAKTLYNLAKNGDARSCMFWLKTRAGWRETERHEITGADGSAFNPPVIEVVFNNDDDEKEG